MIVTNEPQIEALNEKLDLLLERVHDLYRKVDNLEDTIDDFHILVQPILDSTIHLKVYDQ